MQVEAQSARLLSPVPPTSAQPLSARPLTDPAGTDLRAGPVDMSLELWIPSLQLSAPVLAVGITSKNVMDAPGGLADDPVWQKAFWYRGSGVPGDLGTATIAGHVVDMLGRPAAFANLKDLRPGNLIIIHDTRSGLNVRFLVVKTESYSVQQAADPAVLAQIYGSGPLSGKGPQAAPDGLSHLTLITCSGDFINGSYDHRWVVYSERVQAMPRGRADEDR
jgi:sortase (surface protein transpeptidase)